MTGDNCPGHGGQLSPRAEGDKGQDTLSLKGVPCPLPQDPARDRTDPRQLRIDFENPGVDWREATVIEIFGPWDGSGRTACPAVADEVSAEVMPCSE